MNLVDELHAISAAFGRAEIHYAVCGGVAVTIYGATRSTKDIDVLIARYLDGALEVSLPEGPLMVVSRDVLLRMKQVAGRAQDLADIEKLTSPGEAP